jgi:hypothetical protein
MIIRISVGERAGFLADILLAWLVQLGLKVANALVLERIALH